MYNGTLALEGEYAEKNHANTGDVSQGMLAAALPPTTALALARASIHLMQTGNELYTAISKYLISRPFADVKDIPLVCLLPLLSSTTRLP